MTWIEDIGTYLQTNLIGTLATDVFYQGFPGNAPNCITLLNQGGREEETGATDDYSILFPELGIRVRDIDDSTAYQKSQAIINLLSNVYNSILGSTTVISIEAINSDPLFVEQDENDRYVYSCNFSLEIEGS